MRKDLPRNKPWITASNVARIVREHKNQSPSNISAMRLSDKSNGIYHLASPVGCIECRILVCCTTRDGVETHLSEGMMILRDEDEDSSNGFSGRRGRGRGRVCR